MKEELQIKINEYTKFAEQGTLSLSVLLESFAICIRVSVYVLLEIFTVSMYIVQQEVMINKRLKPR